MVSEWGNTYGDLFAKLYGSDMGKHNQSHIGCLHWPKVVPTKANSIWVLNGETHMGPSLPNYMGKTWANTISPIKAAYMGPR